VKLFVKTQKFKAAMGDLIDTVDLGPHGWDVPFRERVMEIINEHQMALGDEYASLLIRMLSFGARAKAHRLIDCFADSERTHLGNLVLALLRGTSKVMVLAVFVVFVMWLYGKLGAS